MTFLVVGDANADLSAALPRFPAEGDDVRLQDVGWGSGGSATNVATALALLGAPTKLLARVGTDPAAALALRAALAAGVDPALLQRDAAVATGLCFAAISPGGERTFFSFRGANTLLASPDAQSLQGIGWLHLGGHALLEGRQRETALALIAWANEQAVPVSLDLCLPLVRGHRPLLEALLPQLRALFGNEPELDALDYSAAPPQQLVVRKRGAEGCAWRWDSAEQRCSAFAVPAVDTNGCGDAFVAGFLHALSLGHATPTCALIGNAMGALTATRPGSADALPSLTMLREFLAERTGGALL